MLPYVLVKRKRPVPAIVNQFKGKLIINWSGSTSNAIINVVVHTSKPFSNQGYIKSAIWAPGIEKDPTLKDEARRIEQNLLTDDLWMNVSDTKAILCQLADEITAIKGNEVDSKKVLQEDPASISLLQSRAETSWNSASRQQVKHGGQPSSPARYWPKWFKCFTTYPSLQLQLNETGLSAMGFTPSSEIE
uniref:Uncharacterized protein n=1 Tax=Ditylenchus dipsaci TaxID=166011 RepID=A0A915CNC2_9BILA